MVSIFRDIGMNMNIKVHFHFGHLDHLLETLWGVSNKKGERFHQDMMEMETHYQGRWHTVMMAD